MTWTYLWLMLSHGDSNDGILTNDILTNILQLIYSSICTSPFVYKNSDIDTPKTHPPTHVAAIRATLVSVTQLRKLRVERTLLFSFLNSENVPPTDLGSVLTIATLNVNTV